MHLVDRGIPYESSATEQTDANSDLQQIIWRKRQGEEMILLS
jgi:hypothetical protein